MCGKVRHPTNGWFGSLVVTAAAATKFMKSSPISTGEKNEKSRVARVVAVVLAVVVHG